MSGNNAYGIFRSRSALERAVDLLRAADFRADDVSMLFPDRLAAEEAATKMVEGAAVGALLGGALGWLVGIGTLAIPGMGAFIAAGPVMGALAGAGLGGAAGGIGGALIGMGIPEENAKHLEGRMKDGYILLSISCVDQKWARQAERIMRQSGAEEVAAFGDDNVFDFSDERDLHLLQLEAFGREKDNELAS